MSSRRGHVGRPLPELDSELTICPGRHLRAEPFRRSPCSPSRNRRGYAGSLRLHRPFLPPCAEASGRPSSAGRSGRRRSTMTRSFLSLIYSSTAGDHGPLLDVRFDHARHTRFLINVEKGHVGEVSRGNHCRGRSVPTWGRRRGKQGCRRCGGFRSGRYRRG